MKGGTTGRVVTIKNDGKCLPAGGCCQLKKGLWPLQQTFVHRYDGALNKYDEGDFSPVGHVRHNFIGEGG